MSLLQRLYNMFSLGFIPSITLPTRLTNTSATLIDNVFTNNIISNRHISGILLSDMSDQLPYFYCIDKNILKCSKLTSDKYKHNFNESNIHKLFNELSSKNLENLLHKNIDIDPNITTFRKNVLSDALDKHIPLKKIKFRKYKDKNSSWITDGILKSIKFRDNMYKRMKQATPYSTNFNTLKSNLTTYNRIIKRSILEAKHIYYDSTFKKDF